MASITRRSVVTARSRAWPTGVKRVMLCRSTARLMAAWRVCRSGTSMLPASMPPRPAAAPARAQFLGHAGFELDLRRPGRGSGRGVAVGLRLLAARRRASPVRLAVSVRASAAPAGRPGCPARVAGPVVEFGGTAASRSGPGRADRCRGVGAQPLVSVVGRARARARETRRPAPGDPAARHPEPGPRSATAAARGQRASASPASQRPPRRYTAGRAVQQMVNLPPVDQGPDRRPVPAPSSSPSQ